jgi:hypothetical protein
MKIRKRFATLIELLISLGLTGILVTLLLGAYWQAQRLDSQARSARSWVDSKQLVQIQLQRWLSSATLGEQLEKLPEKAGERSPYFFYTDGSTLTWTGHTSPSIDPELSGDLLMRLYVDQQQQLCLTMWPLPTKEHLQHPIAHQIVLAQKVAGLEFSFYRPPPQAHEPPDSVFERPPSGWTHEWALDAEELPAMVKVRIDYADGLREPLLLAFQVAKGSPTVVYSKDRI